ncbi:MAG: hypothetical protein ACI4C3_11140 [Bacteroides sp.]
MNECRERNIELITEVMALDVTQVGFSKYLGDERKYIQSSLLNLPDGGGTKIPFDPKSATLSESEKRATAGLCYECELSFTLSNPTSEQYENIDYLMDINRHLLITTFGGDRFIVPAEESSWKPEQVWSGKNLSVSVKFTNLCGALHII